MISAPVALDSDARQPVKSYHVVPLDDADDHDDSSNAAARRLADLREPLRAGDSRAQRVKNKQAVLASTRVQRDRLLRKLEELAMTEAELASAYELFDYTRKRCSHEHEQIVRKLTSYEALLREMQSREQAMQLAGVDDVLRSEQERDRWRQTKQMVAHTLPELLARLENNIDVNSEKIRGIQDKMEQIRAHRLAVREAIAGSEEDIALALQ
ncbi:hypothetical protein PybrP1_001890 [[Pythium] brassicae (nom. inval.)]|nr:hypothetical protein PybrP1_001890 [[Pythium] brassicae (nom. inval.)]